MLKRRITKTMLVTIGCIFASAAFADISSLRNKTLVCENTQIPSALRGGMKERFFVTKDRVYRFGIGSDTGGEIFVLGVRSDN